MSSKHVSQNKRTRERARQARRDAREVRALLKMPVESRRGMERRAAKRRRLFWKVSTWLGVLTASVIVGVVLFQRAFYDNPEFLMKRVDIETDGTLTRDEIRAMGGIPAEANLLKLDLKVIDDRLEVRSQIGKAQVRRLLPDTLEIRVKERVPVTWLGYKDGGLAKYKEGIMLDSAGIAIQCHTLHPHFFNLPVILVPKESIEEHVLFGQAVALEEVQAALRLLMKWPLAVAHPAIEVSQIDASRPYRMDVYCHPDLKLLMDYENFDGQLMKLFDVMRHGERNGREFAQINLTVRDNVPVIYQDFAYQRPLRGEVVRPEPRLSPRLPSAKGPNESLSDEEVGDILSIDS